MYEPAVGTQYMNGSGFIRISVYLIAPEETRRQINDYTGGGGDIFFFETKAISRLLVDRERITV